MTELVYAIADLLEWTFGILTMLGNLPNALFTLLIFGGLVLWMVVQQRMIKADRKNGRLI